MVNRRKDSLKDKAPGCGIGQRIIVVTLVLAEITMTLLDEIDDADDNAVQDVRNVGGEEIEGKISQGGGRNVASLVEEANVPVAGDAHLLPTGQYYLRWEGIRGGGALGEM